MDKKIRSLRAIQLRPGMFVDIDGFFVMVVSMQTSTLTSLSREGLFFTLTLIGKRGIELIYERTVHESRWVRVL